MSNVGLFSSDPFSRRAQSLEEAFCKLGIDAMQVMPWKVSRKGATSKHEISMNGVDLSSLDLLIVLKINTKSK